MRTYLAIRRIGFRSCPVGAFKGQERNPVLRPAFTMMELAVCLAVLSVVIVLMAQLAAWNARERAQLAARQAAVEAAHNVLEAARIEPWDDLNDDWAEKQKLSLEESPLPTDARMSVRVEPEPKFDRLKRVTVRIRWNFGSKFHRHEVELSGLFGRRLAAKEGAP